MPVSPELAGAFIRSLSHTKGQWAGQPFNVLDWQDELIRRLFELKPDGNRKIRRAYIQTARKSGKSEIGAALALTLLVCDGEPGGEVIGAAAKKDQARIILDTAKRMVRYGTIGGRPLSDFLTVRRDGIYFAELDAVYKVVSADGEKEHGLNPHAVIFDEVHSLGTKRDTWDALETAQGARRNPLMISFTTPGPIPKGVAYDEYQYATKVMRGVINDPEFLGVIYEADRQLAIDDPTAWAQANPSYPITPSYSWLSARAKAVLEGRAPEYVFRRLQLSQWTTAIERWLPRKKYEACGKPVVIPDGAEVWVGIDAALKRDSFGIAVVYKTREFVTNEEGIDVPEDVAHVRVRAFVPEEEGEYIDQEEVRMYLLGLANLYKIQNVAYDPAYMTLMAQQLAESGLPMTPYPQSPERMSVATETFQNLILSERLRHGNERTFDEQVANLGTVQTDRGVRISKRKSGGRIDAITAAVMALDVCFGDADPPQQDFAELT